MSDRGQLVVLAAAVVAVALVPVLAASLQLGYAGDVRAGDAYREPSGDVERALAASLRAATPNRTDWSERAAVLTAVRTRMRETTAGLANASGPVLRLSLAADRAAGYARERCPGGPGRAFGPCVADAGVVLQERAGDAVVVAVLVRVERVGDGRRATRVLVVRPPERAVGATGNHTAGAGPSSRHGPVTRGVP